MADTEVVGLDNMPIWVFGPADEIGIDTKVIGRTNEETGLGTIVTGLRETYRPPATNARATARSYIDGGVLKYAAANQSCFEDGLLSISPAVSNLLEQTESFDNAYWNNLGSRLNITADAGTAPDGSNTADLITATESGNNYYGITKGGITVVNGTTYTHSRFVKHVDQRWVYMDVDGGATSAWFDLLNETVGTESPGVTGRIENIGNGWLRLSITYTATDTSFGEVALWFCDTDNGAQFSGGTTSIYMWGAQLTASSVPLPYAPNDANNANDMGGSSSADAISFTLPQDVKDLLSTEQPPPTSAYDETSGALVLSTVDGTAFAMPNDGSGADISPYAGTHVIKLVDSAGKVAWGYLGAAGTGETLGSELLDNPDFDLGDQDWDVSDPTWSIADQGGGDYEGVATAVPIDYMLYQTATGLTANILMKVTAECTNYTSGGAYVRAHDGTNQQLGTLLDGVKSGVLYYTSRNTAWTVAAARASANGTTLRVDGFSAKQVTAPPATGTWIVDTPGGATKNFAYIESGFDPNDISTYDLYPIGQWRSEGTLVVEWVPGFGEGDVASGNHGIISITDSDDSLLLFDAGVGIWSYDGTNYRSVDPAVIASTPYNLAVRWNSATNQMQVGYDSTWGTAASYDGAFTLGSNLNFGYSPAYPFKLGRVLFYDKWMPGNPEEMLP